MHCCQPSISCQGKGVQCIRFIPVALGRSGIFQHELSVFLGRTVSINDFLSIFWLNKAKSTAKMPLKGAESSEKHLLLIFFNKL